MIIDFKEEYYHKLVKKNSDYDLSYLLKNNEFNKDFIFLINDEPIGLISFSVIYDRIELNYIWVDKLYRKKGIASKMIEFMCNNDDIKNITLEVSIENKPAIELYKKYGFKIVSIRKNYYKNIDAYLMMKEMM